MPPSLRDRFRGCLLGLALGDALGGRFEAQRTQHLLHRFPTPEALFDYPQDELWYTDDTQMAIGVAEALVARGEIVEEVLCARFVENFVPSRGYGRGARVVLEAMEEGGDYQAVAERHFPGGSYGNGAAMRVAPVGLLFRNNRAQVQQQATLSALPTHRHPLGIEGACLLACGVALACTANQLDGPGFLAELLDVCQSDVYRDKLLRAQAMRSPAGLAELGNGIQAQESVVTALASFALSPESYIEAVGQVILIGGDTDTLAAMAGALSGAYLGAARLPGRAVSLLERSPGGHDYLVGLADQLWERSVARE